MTSPRIIAAKNGERKYTGKPCKVCGCTERYTANASCVECTKKSAFKNADLIRQHIQEAREGA